MSLKHFGLSIALALGLSGCDYQDPSFIFSKDPVYVFAGSAGFNSSKSLKSAQFVSCSALVLDHGDDAVLVHAMPGDKIMYRSVVNVANAVDFASTMMRCHGIDPSKCQAYINAGSSSDLDTLLGDLAKQKIHVQKSSVSPATLYNPREVSFDPVTNDFSVKQKNIKL